MHAFPAAGASFLLAVLWFDLMFDVQARTPASALLPADKLASISAYYRRVTTGARPMNLLIPVIMLATVVAIVLEITNAAEPAWVGWTSFGLAIAGIGLAVARTVPNARRLGRASDPPDTQSRLARAIYRDHQLSFAAILAVIALQLATTF